MSRFFPTRNPANWGGAGIVEPIYDWIRSHLPDQSHILELGSGEINTQYLSEHYRMTSVEDNPAYWDKFASHYIKASLVDGWYNTDILKSELPADYDFCWWTGLRAAHHDWASSAICTCFVPISPSSLTTHGARMNGKWPKI